MHVKMGGFSDARSDEQVYTSTVAKSYAIVFVVPHTFHAHIVICGLYRALRLSLSSYTFTAP